MDEDKVVIDKESKRLLEELAKRANVTPEEMAARLIADSYAKVASHPS